MTFRLTRQLGQGRRGFTLIELLVVIAIIGILAAVVLVSLNSARVRGRDARRLSDLQAIALAMEVYNDQNNGVYPDVGAGNQDNPTVAGFTALVDNTNDLVSADLIPSAPDDPLAGRDYWAAVSSDEDSYLLGAGLEETNQALTSDYDNAGLGGTAGTCDDGDVATDNLDFCICQGPDCA